MKQFIVFISVGVTTAITACSDPDTYNYNLNTPAVNATSSVFIPDGTGKRVNVSIDSQADYDKCVTEAKTDYERALCKQQAQAAAGMGISAVMPIVPSWYDGTYLDPRFAATRMTYPPPYVPPPVSPVMPAAPAQSSIDARVEAIGRQLVKTTKAVEKLQQEK